METDDRCNNVYTKSHDLLMATKKHVFIHPHDGPGPMDRPRQDDSSAGHMEGQTVGIDCGSVGAPL